MQGIFNAIGDFFALIYSIFKLIFTLLTVFIDNSIYAIQTVFGFLFADVPIVPRLLGVIIAFTILLSIILKIFGRSMNNDH